MLAKRDDYDLSTIRGSDCDGNFQRIIPWRRGSASLPRNAFLLDGYRYWFLVGGRSFAFSIFEKKVQKKAAILAISFLIYYKLRDLKMLVESIIFLALQAASAFFICSHKLQLPVGVTHELRWYNKAK